jgi:hypothetical protein
LRLPVVSAGSPLNPNWHELKWLTQSYVYTSLSNQKSQLSATLNRTLLASSYLTRLGPKAIVELLLPNGPREHENGTVNCLLRDYYNDQAKMNDWARILQSPASISQLWVEELRVRGCEASPLTCDHRPDDDEDDDENREDKKMVEPEQRRWKVDPRDEMVRPSDLDE